MTTALYDTDLNRWLQEQISYLRDKQFDKLDIEHLIEEVESVGKTERRSMRSYFVVLLGHLLKLKYQPDMASGSWYNSIENSQEEIRLLIKDSPSLKREMAEKMHAAWPAALKLAIRETGLPKNTFPSKCSWSVEYVMKEVADEPFYR